jgi:hypothetical protein
MFLSYFNKYWFIEKIELVSQQQLDVSTTSGQRRVGCHDNV